MTGRVGAVRGTGEFAVVADMVQRIEEAERQAEDLECSPDFRRGLLQGVALADDALELVERMVRAAGS